MAAIAALTSSGIIINTSSNRTYVDYHHTSGADLLVAVLWRSSNIAITSVKFNNVSMTLVRASGSGAQSSGTMQISVYRMDDPGDLTGNVVVTYAGSIEADELYIIDVFGAGAIDSHGSTSLASSAIYTVSYERFSSSTLTLFFVVRGRSTDDMSFSSNMDELLDINGPNVTVSCAAYSHDENAAGVLSNTANSSLSGKGAAVSVSYEVLGEPMMLMAAPAESVTDNTVNVLNQLITTNPPTIGYIASYVEFQELLYDVSGRSIYIFPSILEQNQVLKEPRTLTSTVKYLLPPVLIETETLIPPTISSSNINIISSGVIANNTNSRTISYTHTAGRTIDVIVLYRSDTRSVLTVKYNNVPLTLLTSAIGSSLGCQSVAVYHLSDPGSLTANLVVTYSGIIQADQVYILGVNSYGVPNASSITYENTNELSVSLARNMSNTFTVFAASRGKALNSVSFSPNDSMIEYNDIDGPANTLSSTLTYLQEESAGNLTRSVTSNTLGKAAVVALSYGDSNLNFSIEEAASILDIPWLDGPAGFSREDSSHILGLYRYNFAGTSTGVTLEAALSKSILSSVSLNSVVLKILSNSVMSEACVQDTIGIAIDTDTAVYTTLSTSTDNDVVTRKAFSIESSGDSVIQKAFQKTANLDTPVLKALSASLSSNTAILKRFTLTSGFEPVVSKVLSNVLIMSAAPQKTLTITPGFDTSLVQPGERITSTNFSAMIRGTANLAFALDTLLSINPASTFRTLSFNSVVAKSILSSVNLSPIIRKSLDVSTSLNATIFSIRLVSTDIGVVLGRAIPTSVVNTDSVIKKSIISNISLSPVIAVQDSSSTSYDLVLEKIGRITASLEPIIFSNKLSNYFMADLYLSLHKEEILTFDAAVISVITAAGGNYSITSEPEDRTIRTV